MNLFYFHRFDSESNRGWLAPFTFIQAADSQFGLIHELQHVDWTQPDVKKSIEQSKQYKALGYNEWIEEIRLSSLAIDQWLAMVPRPRFVVICGDLINDFPGLKFEQEQSDDFKRTFSKLGHHIPLVLLPGNHDILDRPTVDSIQTYRSRYGDDYFAYWVDGVMFLVINVQYYKDGSLVRELAQEHDAWIDDKLKEAVDGQYKHVIVFQHIPWFVSSLDEPEHMFNIAATERRRMLAKFSRAGIRAIFCGHYHRNGHGQYEQMEIIITSALGAQIHLPDDVANVGTSSGYRIVQVDEDSVHHRYVNIE